MAKRHKRGRQHETRRRIRHVWGWAWWHEGGRARGEHEGGCVDGSGAANRGHAHRKQRATGRGHQRHASTAGKG
eukprot:2137199-Prymnesium_polylepis.1